MKRAPRPNAARRAAATIHLLGAKRGLTVTPEIREAILNFIAAADQKEQLASQMYRDCYRSLERLAALLGKKAMFRVGTGPAFKLGKPRPTINYVKDVAYFRTDARSQSLRWSEIEAEKAGFRFAATELPGLERK